MTRPTPATLARNSAAFAETETLRTRLRHLGKLADRVFGYSFLPNLALGIASACVWFVQPLPVGITVAVAFVVGFGGVCLLLGRFDRQERQLYAQLDEAAAAFRDEVRSAISADALATYGMVIDPADAPLEAAEAARIAATVGGEQVTVLAGFPDPNSPLLLERVEQVASLAA